MLGKSSQPRSVTWSNQEKPFLFGNYTNQATYFCGNKNNPQLDSIIKRTEIFSNNTRMSPIDLQRFKKLDSNIRGFSIENLIGGDQDSS